MLARLRSAVNQWTELGGMATLRFFANYWRRNGFIPALVQAYRRLFWAGGSQYVQLFERWFARNDLNHVATEAIDVFAGSRVLIVGALDLPQCKKYRVLQKIELLGRRGVDANLAHYLDAKHVLNNLQLCTLLILYRAPDCDEVRGYLREARRLGIAVGFDIDDPIFDREVYSENPNLDFLKADERKQLLASCDQYLAVLRQVDFVVVSTAGMERVARKHFPGEIWRWPNVIDGEIEAILETAAEQDEPGYGEAAVISYMSGSRAHEQDFRVASDALAVVLQRYPDVLLLIGGYLELPESLQPFSERVRRFPFVGYQGYFSQLRQADINIVPLVDNTFNACKSTIRYLEASAVSVPSVVSAVGDFEQQVEHGVTGFLAREQSDWINALSHLLDHPEQRAQVGSAANRFVMGNCTVSHLETRLAADIDQLLAKRGR